MNSAQQQIATGVLSQAGNTQPPVQHQLVLLSKQLSQLNGLLDDLHGKLAPVLGPATPLDKAPTSDKTVTLCNLGVNIADATETIDNVNSRLRAILRDIQI